MSEIFPWRSWIELLKHGDARPFFCGLKQVVYGAAFFKGKAAVELRNEYGDRVQEEVLQMIAVELLERGVLDEYQGLDDTEIAGRVTNRVRSTIIDVFRKRRRDTAIFQSSKAENRTGEPGGQQDLSDYHSEFSSTEPSPEVELENRQLIERILSHLTKRQIFILENYKSFGIGTLSGDEIKDALKVSIQLVNSEVQKIRVISRKLALQGNLLLIPGKARNALD